MPTKRDRDVGREILEGLRQLKRGEAGRVTVVSTADPSEADIERLWLDEAERRERAWDAGEVEAIPVEKVMRELRK